MLRRSAAVARRPYTSARRIATAEGHSLHGLTRIKDHRRKSAQKGGIRCLFWPIQDFTMSRLFLLLFSLIGPSLAGVGVIIVLTIGMVALNAIVSAAALGFALGVPVSWAVMRQLAPDDE